MNNSLQLQEQFTLPLLKWFANHGRHDLPWQHPRSAYRVWISEIMLQQTQVQTVIPYFEKFMSIFPSLEALALAEEDQVLALWSGLGYYSRARNIYKTAQILHTQFQGIWPQDVNILETLPGIGPSTAAAIASQAFNQATAILDGNVKRVLCRYFLIEEYPEKSQVKKKLWQLAQACMSTKDCANYTQAIMDLGATCCKLKNPSCYTCPLSLSCTAFKQDRVSELPIKKPKKIIPSKKENFLLLYNKEGQIYLHKNPPTGIWGGLWCIPHLDSTLNIETYLRQSNFLSEKAQSLGTFKHSFTHFHLHISAMAIQVNYIETLRIAESVGQWFAVEDSLLLGLAKPVKKIIEDFHYGVVKN